MARRKISAADFDLQAGSAKDAKTFAKFVEQEGAAALPVIEEALAGGASRVKQVAWLGLAALDLASAESRALAAAEGAESLKKKQLKEAVVPLQCVATPACLERVEKLGVEVYPDSLPREALGRAQRFAMERLLRSSDQEQQEAVLQEWFPKYNHVPGTLDLLRGSLAESKLLARASVLELLIEARDVEACRAPDVPMRFLIAARFALSPEEAFDRLNPVFEHEPELRDELIRTLALQKERDVRWVEFFAAFPNPQLSRAGLLASRRPEALPYLVPLIRAMTPGPTLLEALADLRGFNSPEAAALIVPWLERKELDANAALLSTSLRECGMPNDVPALQAAAKRNPDGAIFYLEAARHIEARYAQGS